MLIPLCFPALQHCRALAVCLAVAKLHFQDVINLIYGAAGRSRLQCCTTGAADMLTSGRHLVSATPHTRAMPPVAVWRSLWRVYRTATGGRPIWMCLRSCSPWSSFLWTPNPASSTITGAPQPNLEHQSNDKLCGTCSASPACFGCRRFIAIS